MTPSVTFALSLLFQAIPASTYYVHRGWAFDAAEWDYFCDVGVAQLRNCRAEKKLDNISLQLEDRNGVTLSVGGGCAAGGSTTVDAVDAELFDGRYRVNALAVRAIAVNRVNARRAACGQTALSEEAKALLELDVILFVQIAN